MANQRGFSYQFEKKGFDSFAHITVFAKKVIRLFYLKNTLKLDKSSFLNGYVVKEQIYNSAILEN